MSELDTTKVWDPLVRVCHWALAAAFFAAFVSADDGWLPLHAAAGYTVLGLVLLRVIWGFIGPAHARFSSLVHRPSNVWQYLKQLVLLKPPRYLGHNPLGGAMAVLLLSVLILTAVSGLMLYGTDQHAGPLVQWLAGSPWAREEWLDETHEVLADLSVFLIVFHVAGVILDSCLHRENLAKAMITGRKASIRQ